MTTGRSRMQVAAFASQGTGISVAWNAPVNCTLLFFSITYGGLPNVADVLKVSKSSGTDSRISPTFRTILIGENQWESAVCNETFELLKGDRLVVFADNGNDVEVGFEAILQEGT